MIRFYFYNESHDLQKNMDVAIVDEHILRGGGYMG